MWTQEATPTEALLDGRYRLAEAVGVGGMATVYRAEDIALERTVAVKVFRESDDTLTSADRAHSEKALLASLNHPNLVTLLDANLMPGRTKYLVMEFVPGPTLSMRLARASVAPHEVAHIGADIAAGLHAVHAAGIVHRDVKPSNVLLTPPSPGAERWTAKLADFGIACAIDTSRMTTPGVVLGTLTYMAPEQLRNAELRPAVDVYALALVLLEALTGKPGYTATTSVESALARLHLPPDIPESLGQGWVRLLTAMTNVDPEQRPRAAEVEVELRRLSQPITEPTAADVATVPLRLAPTTTTAPRSTAAPRSLTVPEPAATPAPVATSVSVTATLPLAAAPHGSMPASAPRTRAEARQRTRRRPAGTAVVARSAVATARRRPSVLVAAVVAVGIVVSAAAALSGSGQPAVASSGAVRESLSVVETSDASTEVPPPAIVEETAPVVPASTSTDPQLPAAPADSADASRRGPAEAAADTPGSDNRGKGNNNGNGNGNGNGAKGKGAER